jgi:uncharacterized membrane protein (UPF0127 family)
MEKAGGYMGMLSLKANKEFGLMLGTNKNMITWKNMTAQPIYIIFYFEQKSSTSVHQ